MRRFLTLLAAASLSFAASLAHADSLRLTDFTGSQQVSISGAGNFPSAYAGQLYGSLNGASFKTYCVDLYQAAYLQTTYTDYSVVSGVTAFGATKSTEIDHLLSYFATHLDTSRSPDSALAQAAVWEVLYEKGSSYDIAKGTFSVFSTAGSTEKAFTSFDWNAVAATPITLHADQLYSASEQDFIRVTPVPEPSTYAMLAGGLGALGFVARRRRANA